MCAWDTRRRTTVIDDDISRFKGFLHLMSASPRPACVSSFSAREHISVIVLYFVWNTAEGEMSFLFRSVQCSCDDRRCYDINQELEWNFFLMIWIIKESYLKSIRSIFGDITNCDFVVNFRFKTTNCNNNYISLNTAVTL